MAEDDLTVVQAAEALGTSAQTVRKLLRTGELGGERRAWGTRFVWVSNQRAVDEFLAEYGRLDGHRRRRSEPAAETVTPITGAETVSAPPASPPPLQPEPPEATPAVEPDTRPFVLRPRGRATVVVVVLGIPLVTAYVVARLLPDALWHDELGQSDVFRRVLLARVELYLLVGLVVAAFVALNLMVAAAVARIVRTPATVLSIVAVAIVTGSIFASTAAGNWQQYLLWRHRQSFGIVDPIHGEDVGYFVFSLPFESMVATLLMWLVGVAACGVALVYWARGMFGVKPLRSSFEVQLHLGGLAATFLLVVAWRLHLSQYSLELQQPGQDRSFAGAGYTDTHVELPALRALAVLAVVLAVVCVVAPIVARTGRVRRESLLIAVPAAILLAGFGLSNTLIPAIVQRYAVDPNPLLSEQPYLERSISATRAGLGLDQIQVEPYEPVGRFRAADFAAVRERLTNIGVWDSWLLEARMRELVTATPYYSPEPPALDVVKVDGRPRPTIVSARELDLRPVRGLDHSWISDRLSYTHGLGLIRFSSTDVDADREPRVLDSGLGVREPRIYFGNLPEVRAQVGGAAEEDDEDEDSSMIFTQTTGRRVRDSAWVLINTRRPEVDIPAAGGGHATPYHYDGPGGIELSSWVRRAAFALALGSKELLISDDITPDSRILLHRDVNERLDALAPFIQWDSNAIPLTVAGRIVFVVDGYTTSANYPYAERVSLAGSSVNYARASVRATVDAYSGEVRIYVADESDPIVRAWVGVFPGLFDQMDDMPTELRARLRYPPDLFAAQASAYETFHATRPDVFVSGADAWSRPIALSGPIEVAGYVDFDESDEDDLRLTMQPGYAYAPPPDETDPQLVLSTFYTPRSAQGLVATLSGWIDQDGALQLKSLSLPRDPITLGPAQISRLVFATPRVRNLLGLRNLEIRDLETSSLDAVLLGQPHLLLLPSGVIQTQSLYEGSRGPGAARLLGVTAYVNGRAGLGPNVESAVRQALNEPPRVDVVRPEGPFVVGQPVRLAFDVEHARGEVVTIASADGRVTRRLGLSAGRGSVTWTPQAAGEVHVGVAVTGLDGTLVRDGTTFRVVGPSPTVRLVDPPKRAVVGRSLRLSFEVNHAVDEWARVSMSSGIVFLQHYVIRNGTGVIDWQPTQEGPAVLLIRATGPQGQVTDRRLRITVAPRPDTASPPTLTLINTPPSVTIGVATELQFRAADCDSAVARIERPGGVVRVWRFPCPAQPAHFAWTPRTVGDYRLSVIARAGETSTRATTSITAVQPP